VPAARAAKRDHFFIEETLSHGAARYHMELISLPHLSRLARTIAIGLPLAIAAIARAQSPAPLVFSLPPALPAIDAHQRLKWLLDENLDAASLFDDVAVGAVDTFFKTPKEYNTHWSGFGERTGFIAANYGVKSTMEAGLGAFWGEDPRYFRTDGKQPLKRRLAYVIKATFLARDRNGNTMPAYARLFAVPASSFLSNAWQPHSEATLTDAVVRTGLGFLSRMGENAWKEFIVRRH